MSVSPLPEDVMGMDWVKLAKIRIPRYQRPEPSSIEKLVAGWDTRKSAAIIVSFRDDAYWMVDGQTRAKAARRLGLEFLLAVIQYGLSEREEAELFLALNRDHRKVNPIGCHRAEVIALEPRALAIDEVLNRHGLIVATGTHPIQNRMPFKAIVAAKTAFDEGGSDLLDRTLGMLDIAFAGESSRFKGVLVGGLAHFLARDPWDADDPTVLKALRRTTTQKLDELATHWRLLAGGATGGMGAIYMAKGIARVVYPDSWDNWKPNPRDEGKP